MPTYLDSNRITGKRQTQAPLNRSRTGYGPKIPTSWLLQLDGKKWYRVYVMIYSNSGSAYVVDRGQTLFLGPYEPSYTSPSEAKRLFQFSSRRGITGKTQENPVNAKLEWRHKDGEYTADSKQAAYHIYIVAATFVLRSNTGYGWRELGQYDTRSGAANAAQLLDDRLAHFGYARGTRHEYRGPAFENPLHPEQYALVGIGILGAIAVIYELTKKPGA
jgi:hypothetical protein